ncbi:hypothetical protein BDU57DRAFT_537049 [Ampelomyces quisqualis]|uniref:Uncharacterized protein n=1 Tax=Ampelomyces quisqualis TaxID=50730 RepID=A0A6A5QTT6_AMPQU|nr:hypothetical protein BDU57DRAFT_537049 [Ampelomyces quisqualis]
MPSTNLIVALVFAALFGAALVWLAIYYLHRYIHRRCLELDHWFHVLTPPHWRSTCRHCDGTGREGEKKARSRSRSAERSRSRGRREKSRGRHVRAQRVIEADTEWNGIGREVQRARHALPAASPSMMQSADVYNPWLGWQGQMPGVQQFAQPATYPAMYPQAYQQYVPRAAPIAMQPPIVQQQAMPTPSSLSSMPSYQKHPRRAHTERSEAPSKSKHAPKEGPRVRKTDYIHIVDDYPPIVKEAIKKAAPPRHSTSASSTSSTSTEPAEEVPRKTIPQVTPRFAEPPPFPFPQYPHLAPRAWDPPAAYPQQFGFSGATEQARYESPYMRRMALPVGADRRGHYPSNSPPERSDSFGTRNWRRERRMEDVITSQGRRRRRFGRENPLNRTTHVQQRAEAPDHPNTKRSMFKAKDAEKDQPGGWGSVPAMSPMPLPVVEEPVSDCGSDKSKGPIVLGMPEVSEVSTETGPKESSSVPSPLVHVQPRSTSPLSAEASL